MKNPKSFTGEDVIEIHCHGGTFITQKVLERVLKEGARAALPGEFTFRAFKNNKIDLAQAEAIQKLISAKNEIALSAAHHQLEGALSHLIQSFQKKIIKITASIEALIDFPEEDIDLISRETLQQELKDIIHKMQHLSSTFTDGKMLFSGINVAIIGTPNVGKSSLMNALCKKEKAIVTPIAGTTRDLLEEKITFGSLHYNLIDTAGIRKQTTPIEQEGIKRSQKIWKTSDITLLVLDASRDLIEEDQELIKHSDPEKTIVLWNKIDLQPSPPKITYPNLLCISAKKYINLDQIKHTLKKLLFKKRFFAKEEIILTQKRHQEALVAAISFAKKALSGIKKHLSFEFIASDLHFCLHHLNTIIGHDIQEDVLSEIFSNFCIGK